MNNRCTNRQQHRVEERLAHREEPKVIFATSCSVRVRLTTKHPSLASPTSEPIPKGSG
jgi:hypothetical protein